MCVDYHVWPHCLLQLDLLVYTPTVAQIQFHECLPTGKCGKEILQVQNQVFWSVLEIDGQLTFSTQACSFGHSSELGALVQTLYSSSTRHVELGVLCKTWVSTCILALYHNR